jgi:hypothetical protein
MADEPVSFVTFVLSLATTAAIHFGDIDDPESHERPPANLPAARQLIEVLDMLQAKTQGNLTLEERQFLEQILYDLRLRYVEAQQGGKRIIEP